MKHALFTARIVRAKRPRFSSSEPQREAVTAPAPESLTRFALILRDRDGKGELLGQLHATEREAVEAARFWQVQRHQHALGLARCTGEVVRFEIATHGTPVSEGSKTRAKGKGKNDHAGTR